MVKKRKAAKSKRKAARKPERSLARKGTFGDLFVKRASHVQAVGKRLRAIVREVLPKAEETVYLGWSIALYKEGKEVCGIQPIKNNRCNFYLSRGAQLPDPDGLLEGTGKSIRHVKVASLAELRTKGAGIKWLIRAGSKLAAE